MKALQFSAPDPERRDMDVVARALGKSGRRLSVARKLGENKALRRRLPHGPSLASIQAHPEYV
ncbi:MAG: hypothetical protein AB7L28_07005 [Kofleriaceae bacterium]